MRRAIRLLIALLAASSLHAPFAFAAESRPFMNSIGLIDYSRKPTFKVGDWAKYKMQGKSQTGQVTDYVLTVLIAGEEDFWGDPSFWVETWVTYAGDGFQAQSAALMSYEIFSDTSATQRLMLYMRKVINEMDEEGRPKIELNKPAGGIMKTRREVKLPVRWNRDTLGVDTVQTPKGNFKAVKVAYNEGLGVTQSVGDSSLYTEQRENRTSWYAHEVPITHLAREDIESISARKSWLIGRSGDVKSLNTTDQGFGFARLIDFGSGETAQVVPERYRHSIAEQVARERAAARPGGSARTKR
jgi:hypothetical protein